MYLLILKGNLKRTVFLLSIPDNAVKAHRQPQELAKVPEETKVTTRMENSKKT